MNRWRIQNIDYDWGKGNPALLRRMAHEDQPWEAHGPAPDTHYQSFATHAEAITYADKQARRTNESR